MISFKILQMSQLNLFPCFKTIIKYHHPNGCVQGAIHVFVDFLGGGTILLANCQFLGWWLCLLVGLSAFGLVAM